MIVDRVQKHHRVDGLQWSLLPFFRDGQDLVYDPADGGIRDLHAVDVTNMGLYVSGSHALGVHRQNLFFYVLTDAGLVFLEHLRLEFALAITGYGNIHIPEAGAQRLAAMAISAVVRVLAAVVIFTVAQFISNSASRLFFMNSAMVSLNRF